MKPNSDQNDPKGLIYEAYRIEGITEPECRTIFLDWALSLSLETQTSDAIKVLLARYDDAAHPMSKVMREGLTTMESPRRRGGWRSRNRH